MICSDNKKIVLCFGHFMKNVTFAVTNKKCHAEIAQLVEHNLAKVRVASSSLVFRSRKSPGFRSRKSPGGGMVDAHVSGACVERHAGSSPVLGTCSLT